MMILQREFSLPVVEIRFSDVMGTPGVTVGLILNTADGREIVDSRTVPLDAFGLGYYDEPNPAVPADLCEWIGHWAEHQLDASETLWLGLVKPYGELGIIPWERDVQPVIARPMLRLPDALPEPDRSTSILNVALVATTAPRTAESVARALDDGIGGRLRLHIFADAATRGALQKSAIRGALQNSKAVLHRWSPDRPSISPADPANPWLRWIRRQLRGVTLDAVHFLAHGDRLGTDGAMLTPGVPNPDRTPTATVQAGELASFLTRVGALAVGFTRAPENPSDSGLRRLADDLGATRAGPVVLHEPADEDMTELRDCYRFLMSPQPAVPPASRHLMLYVQPHQIADLASADDNIPGLESTTAASDSVQRQFDRDDTPVWIAAAQRYVEDQESQLIRFRQSFEFRTPTANEKAYYDGVASGLNKIRDVLDRHAEGSP